MRTHLGNLLRWSGGGATILHAHDERWQLSQLSRSLRLQSLWCRRNWRFHFVSRVSGPLCPAASHPRHCCCCCVRLRRLCRRRAIAPASVCASDSGTDSTSPAQLHSDEATIDQTIFLQLLWMWDVAACTEGIGLWSSDPAAQV